MGGRSPNKIPNTRIVLWWWAIALAVALGLASILVGNWLTGAAMGVLVVGRVIDIRQTKRKLAGGEYVESPIEEIPGMLPDEATVTRMLRARRERHAGRPLD
jgi:hypothetical protein